MMFLTDHIFATMPPQMDSYIWVFNLEGFGYQHFFFEAMKSIVSYI